MNMETFEKPRTRRRAFSKMAALPQFTSIDEFIDWLPQDTFIKYEWNNGKIEQTDYMKFDGRILVSRLCRRFTQTQAYQNGGDLLLEVDIHISPDKYRRPDAAFLTPSQIGGSESQVKYAIPSFLIEVISPNDRINYLENKLQEYFDAGVQVVWHIFPNTKQVWVYSDPLHHIVCSGADICSAAPALPDFEISVDELFRLP